MSALQAILSCAALILVAAFFARRWKPLQLVALCANALFFWYGLAVGSWALLAVNLLLTALNLRALMGKAHSRRPTRRAAQMDEDVHKRIREISAESRYSSAGIEF